MLSWLGQQRLLVARWVLSDASCSDVATPQQLTEKEGGRGLLAAPAAQRQYKDIAQIGEGWACIPSFAASCAPLAEVMCIPAQGVPLPCRQSMR